MARAWGKFNAAVLGLEWRRFGMVAQLMRLQQRGNRFRQARHVLRHVDQGHGQITSRMQDSEAQGADQYHVTA